MTKTDNGLGFEQLLSEVKDKGTLPIDATIAQWVESRFDGQDDVQAVFYLSDGIHFPIWKGNDFDWAYLVEPAKWQEKTILARIFSAVKELKIWREGSALKYRLRDDTQGELIDIVNARQILWGTRFEAAQEKAGWILLQEDRGTALTIPFKGSLDDKKHDRIAIHTHNYIKVLDNGQASYCDSRFVALEKVNESEKQKK